MKRKRKNACVSPLLDDSPKRTKVHAQRKFAQGSNVNSPVITPIKELESENSQTVIMPEPVELLPIKRPNTEDFLTFLCFRGTPILPPNLNFFNTASIVDTNGQVHEIKSECSSKHGPIDVAKCSSSEKPFVAFGVRKRADPIVISRQMDRKRRHALALQALRRKYQEQKMAKIRAITISKLSEKVTNKTLVRTNTVSKTETVTKKSNNNNTLQKTKVVATKHIKVTTRTLKTTMRPKLKIKQNMCLRSFRGRFIQQELPFRKRVLNNKSITRVPLDNKSKVKKKNDIPTKSNEPTTSKSAKNNLQKISNSSSSISTRSTRSNIINNTKSEIRRKQIKRILMPNSHTIIKPKQRSLRLTTIKKSVMSRKQNRPLKNKSKIQQDASIDSKKKETKIEQKKISTNVKGDTQRTDVKSFKETVNLNIESKENSKGKDVVKDYKKVTDFKETTILDKNKRHYTRSLENKKEISITTDIKKKGNLSVATRKTKVSNLIEKKITDGKTLTKRSTRQSDGRNSWNSESEETKHDKRKSVNKNKNEENKSDIIDKSKQIIKKSLNKSKNEKQNVEIKDNDLDTIEETKDNKQIKDTKEIDIAPKKGKLKNEEKEKQIIIVEDDVDSKQVLKNKPKAVDKEIKIEKTDNLSLKPKNEANEPIIIIEDSNSSCDIKKNKKILEKDEKVNKSEDKATENKEEDNEDSITVKLKRDLRKNEQKIEKEESVPRTQRLSRKTKEAAAIYMEILSHKLVNDNRRDEDNISIDSFPELPNVKRTEQRENELKAKAKTPKKYKKDKNDIERKAPKAIDDNVENKETSENSVDEEVSEKHEKIKRKSKEKVETDDIKSKQKLRKNELSGTDIETEELKPKRLMRQTNQVIESDENDSDESFYIDVKVPRKKKNTRSRVSTRVTKTIKTTSISSSESDYSTTSDVNLSVDSNKTKNKKFTKSKSTRKVETISHSEDDDDDEPLSKRQSVNNQTTTKQSNKTKEKKVVQKNIESESSKIETKPKRECARLPQNYLPMFSSSDEEEIFHGFDKKVEPKPQNVTTTPAHAPPLIDLLNKDLSRRFGKEKVNMSKEQIEKWLKDSALAGSSIKKENDEMLKFGERIPTETNMEISNIIDTEKLKESLLGESKKDEKEIKMDKSFSTPVKSDTSKTDESTKPSLDRKLIFRKSKSESIPTPNVSAFSPVNESSVYAFGEDNDEVISTPFRRPSRRPSSTATSKSEDESLKHDDPSKPGQFRKPSIKQMTKEEVEHTTAESEDKQFFIPQKPSKPLVKGQSKALFKSKSSEKLPDIDEFKYKVPSSPSASSSSSAKLYKRQSQKQNAKSIDIINPTYVSDFPKINEPARLVEAPIFQPTEQEFQDPLEYIERIRHKAEQFGICKIIPPSSFKPECKVADDMRFTAYNQYVNKMLHRWGPNFKEFMAIKKYLETQSICLNHPPWIGGMEIDLPRLYQTVQLLGGLKEVIEKKKWSKVSELMKIPKSAQDRVTKLDDIYCKYLLPYDTLSPAEREKLFDEVETEWAKKESRKSEDSKQDNPEADSVIDEDLDECITKGRNMALNAFYRIARNTMSMYFKTMDPTPQEVEQEYWKYVVTRENHICVHSGSIDCGNWGYGFPVTKNSPFAKHPWNLKILTNNNGSVLRSLGPLMGVTVPTLHVGMVFSACCWYRDPHGLPWIEYLHTGGTKIWYGIPNSMGDQFHKALKNLVPNYCKNEELWLQSDTIMVPPNLLVENNVSLCHSVQEPGQFIVVFPKAFTSNISTGYVVSESVFFAPIYWLKTARALFDSLKQSNEPAMFSLDRLLISVVNDGKCNIDIMRQALPLIQELCSNELSKREKLAKCGEMMKEKLPIPEVNKGKKKKMQQGDDGEYECEICRCSLFLSMIFDTAEGITYCLDHALEIIEKKELDVSNCKFMYTYDDKELKFLPDKVIALLETRTQKKAPSKFSGMPTLLGRN